MLEVRGDGMASEGMAHALLLSTLDVLTRTHTQRNTDRRRENLENATNVNVNILKSKG